MKTKQFKIRFIYQPIIAVIGLLILTDFSLRLEPLRDNLPQANPYYNPAVELRTRALKSLIKEQGQPDVLFIGSSVVRTNISPLLFDSVYQYITSHKMTSFNGGLSDLDPGPVSFYLEKFWLKSCKPQIILQAVRYEELKSTFTAENYPVFKTSIYEPLWLKNNLNSQIRLYLLDHVRLYYYSGALTEFLRYPRFPVNRPLLHPIDSRGHSFMNIGMAEAKKLGLLTGDFTYYEDIPDSLLKLNLDALKKSSALCRQSGIKYILVNISEHGDRFLKAPDGLERYRNYISLLRNLAGELNVEFIDLTNGDPAIYQQDDLFSDYYHMSPAGTKKFTTDLARYCAGLFKQDF
ncbi:hypothetical protein JXQ31_18375 [candidate division KSB1 bacterium]|nr:hypothetical protein [candidate division KSB1 bacterium]